MGRVVDAAVNTIHVSLSTGYDAGMDLFVAGTSGVSGGSDAGRASEGPSTRLESRPLKRCHQSRSLDTFYEPPECPASPHSA